MKKGLILFLIAVVLVGLIVASCAPAPETETFPDTSKISSTPVTVSHNITLLHVVGGFTSGYSLDYMEDKENGFGCYIYDGTESGSIYCFKLGE